MFAKVSFILIFFLSFSLLFKEQVQAADKEIVFGVRGTVHPVYFRSPTSPEGILTKIIDGVFQPLDITVRYKQGPRRRVFHELLRGDVALSILPKFKRYREKFEYPEGLILGQEALYFVRFYIYAMKESEIALSDVGDAKLYRIGTVMKAQFLDSGAESVAGSGLDITYFSTPGNLMKSLIAGRVQIIFMSEAAVNLHAEDLGVDVEIFESVLDLGSVGHYLAFSKAYWGDAAMDIRDQTDSQIEEMKRKGVTQRLLSDQVNVDWYHY